MDKSINKRRRTFELRVLPVKDQRYGLALHEISDNHGAEKGENDRFIVRIWGTPQEAVLDRILEVVRSAGGCATDLHAKRRQPFRLDETTGVRLGLLFLAVKPLRKSARIAEISEAIAGMSEEETYYWYAKCDSGPTSRRAQRSLRILLAEE